MMKSGFTTGTCAQAAVKGACIMLARGKPAKRVEVVTASGVKLRTSLFDQQINEDFARCSVIKDAGDDYDVTDGAKISAEVKFSGRRGIIIKGGKGVGKVTKPGLAVGVGEPAINPVPRKMILQEALRFLPKDKGLEITISVPAGEKLARQTYNPKLGIIGGISIIGTTGIVEPKSLDAYRASLALELDVLKAQGHKRAVFILGYVGEKFCAKNPKFKGDYIIKIGDHTGFMLKECAKKKIKEVLLIGHIGKLIKLTDRQFNTHYSFGDNRLECIARLAENCGADKKTIERLLEQKTAEAAIPVLRQAGLTDVFRRIAEDVSRKSMELVNNKVKVNCILLSLDGKAL